MRKKLLPAKRSLDFSSPFTNNTLDINSAPTLSTIPIDPPGSEEITLTPNIPLEDLTPTPASNKRTADELFGDIADIDFNELETMPSKKQKTEEEVDLDLIEKILEGRRLKQILSEPSSRLLTNKCSYNVKDNLSLDIPR